MVSIVGRIQLLRSKTDSYNSNQFYSQTYTPSNESISLSQNSYGSQQQQLSSPLWSSSSSLVPPTPKTTTTAVATNPWHRSSQSVLNSPNSVPFPYPQYGPPSYQSTDSATIFDPSQSQIVDRFDLSQ
ncbi:hypothetical protein BLOT_004409 [Blomia tropicalis]|nr:hypothetical protein BLOT_004409 [Blomia tropicalis]